MDEQPEQGAGQAQTEVPDTPRVEGEASPVPPVLFWSLWIGAFAVVLWGMNLLFGRNRGAPPPDPG